MFERKHFRAWPDGNWQLSLLVKTSTALESVKLQSYGSQPDWAGVMLWWEFTSYLPIEFGMEGVHKLSLFCKRLSRFFLLSYLVKRIFRHCAPHCISYSIRFEAVLQSLSKITKSHYQTLCWKRSKRGNQLHKAWNVLTVPVSRKGALWYHRNFPSRHLHRGQKRQLRRQTYIRAHVVHTSPHGTRVARRNSPSGSLTYTRNKRATMTWQ